MSGGARLRNLCGLFLGIVCAVAVSAAEPDRASLMWLDLLPGAELPRLKTSIEQAGGQVLTLAPEGRLLARWPAGAPKQASSLGGVASATLLGAKGPASPPLKGISDALGWRRAPGKTRKGVEEVCVRVNQVKPNRLAQMRASLEGKADRPSSVDNSLSKYFPFIGNQYSVGACTTWAACYYWNTYTHAQDEDLDVYGLYSDEHRSSPTFLFSLLNQGNDGGSDVLDVMAGLRDLGCCALSKTPNYWSDYTTWPSEEAWIDALKRRTATCRVIGTESGATEEDIEAMKQHLANGNIAVVGLAAYTGWSGWTGEDKIGFNNGVLYADAGSFRSGHGMALIGYDDERPHFDGTETHYGAFLLANQWGYQWGFRKAMGPEAWVSGGFMWVSYDYFRIANEGHDDNLGMAFFNDDREDYRPELFLVTGLNHAQRGEVTCRAGIGSSVAPAWISHRPFDPLSGSPEYMPIADDRRVAIDLTDGIGAIADYGNVALFAELLIEDTSSSNGTLTSADFLYDFRGDGVYETVTSNDPSVTVSPGNAGYATVQFAPGGLDVSPGTSFEEAVALPLPLSFEPAGPMGGPFAGTQVYVLTNSGTLSLDWSASTTASWLDLSSDSGNLAPGANTSITVSVRTDANAYASGQYPGALSFLNESTGTPLARAVELTVRPLHTFDVDVLPAAGPPSQPRTLSITAEDMEGALVRAFEETVTLRAYAQVGETCFIHQDWTQVHYLMNSRYRNGRNQSLYLSDEVGEAGLFTSLSLFISRTPEEALKNWTIRMKHTALSNYNSGTWEDAGWTTVCRCHQEIAGTGWVEYFFDRPFAYNGTDNLAIDFSFSGLEQRTETGLNTWTETSENRSIWSWNNEIGDDPRAWSGSEPIPGDSMAVPDIKLERGVEVPFAPNASSPFSAGVWSGTVSLPSETLNLYLYADDGNGCAGVTPPLASRSGTDADGDGLTYEEESRDLDPYTPGIQNPFDPDSDDTTGDNGQLAPDGVPDGDNDFDGDGMSNADEFDFGFDPMDPESSGQLPLAGPIGVCLLALALLVPIAARHRSPAEGSPSLLRKFSSG